MYFLAEMPPIKISSDVIFNIGPIGITDSMMALMVVNLVIVLMLVIFKRGAGLVPSRLQVALESVVEFFLGNLRAAFGSEKEARRFLPLIFTMFLVILLANQFSILPLLSDLSLGGTTNLFRVPTSDFSLPISMALLVVALANVIAIRIAPIKHLGTYLSLAPFLKVKSLGDFANASLELFLSLLNIIGEIAKVVSLSARLFGNVFAGEVLVLVITYLFSLTNFIVPIPFIFLSIFSGVIHAFVFPLLSTQYLAGTIRSVSPEPELATV